MYEKSDYNKNFEIAKNRVYFLFLQTQQKRGARGVKLRTKSQKIVGMSYLNKKMKIWKVKIWNFQVKTEDVVLYRNVLLQSIIILSVNRVYIIHD